MWTAIILVAVLNPLFRAEFHQGHVALPSQKLCEAAMGEQSKRMTKELKDKFGNNVVVVGQCVKNFQAPPMGPHGEPLPPPNSQAPQPPSSGEGSAPPGNSAPTGPTPPAEKPEAPESEGKNFR